MPDFDEMREAMVRALIKRLDEDQALEEFVEKRKDEELEAI